MGSTSTRPEGEKLITGKYANVAEVMQYCAWITEDTINQASGTRPLDVSHVDPADDPRKNDTRAFIK
jgi:hypothetical protein